MKLLEPFILNNIKIKNRIIMPAMDTNFSVEEGNVPDKLIEYYELRAKGGAGLIIVEAAYFDKIGAGTTTMLSIDSNKRIKKFNELVKVIKKHGAHCLIQIYHAGAQASSFMIGLQAVAPSAVPFEMSGETPKPLTIKQISNIVKEYGNACLRAKKAGFDGVEIHAGHGYLLNQFFSLRTNKREDIYGSQSLENRTRAAVEVIREVRKKCGKEFIIGVRLNGSDYIPEGLEVDDVIQIAQLLEKEGVDLINITGGVFDSPRFPVVPYMNYPRGCFSDNAQLIKEAVEHTPVAVVGRINTPEIAEEILQKEKADLVSLGRALISDPYFPLKITENKKDYIRICIGCNTCLNQIMTEQQVLCAINPNILKDDKEIEKAEKSLNILVVGSGPAGLEFSRIAKVRGHNVKIIERNSLIGGSLNYAKTAPMKKEVQNLIDYYKKIIGKLNIEVSLNTNFTADIIANYKPDTIVLATGVSPKVPKIEGLGKIKYSNYVNVLSGLIPKGQKVVVLGGEMIGIETAEFLSCANKEVTIISDKKRLGTDLYSLVAKEVLPTIEEDDKIEILLETQIKEIKENEIIAQQNDKPVKINFDELVLTLAGPSTETEDYSNAEVDRIFKIGDCKEVHPRKILDSVKEGYELGLIIETPEADILFGELPELQEGDLKSLMRMKIRRRSFTNDDIPDYLDMMAKLCNENEKIRKKNKKTNLIFQISVGDEKNYFIKIENGNFSTGESKVDNPNVTVWMDPSIAGGIFAGTVNSASAYMSKELKFEGSMMHGIKFRSLTEAVIKELEEA
ncbi:MAG: oxidoreductase [Candidatus Heimdallarchaeaceae archaeon]|jgi:2,4-dienoyl-CoA reductase-like NADH-dependent reductase (Old Yellow Enzyme family)/thioredoxin reductase/putative sterol carrier protein